jgi:hypothetical protein
MFSGGDATVGTDGLGSRIPLVKIEGTRAYMTGKIVFENGISLTGYSVTCVLSVTDDGQDTNLTSLQTVISAKATLSGKADCTNPRTGKKSQRLFRNEATGRGLISGALVFLKWDGLVPEGAGKLMPGSNLVFDIELGPRFGSTVPGPRLVNAIVTDCSFSAATVDTGNFAEFLPGAELEDYESGAIQITAANLWTASGWRIHLSSLAITETGGAVTIGAGLVVTGDVIVVGESTRYTLTILGSVLGNIVFPEGSSLGAVVVRGGLLMGEIKGAVSCTSLELTDAHCPNWNPTLAPETVADLAGSGSWLPSLVDDGYYIFTNTLTGRVLDVRGAGGAGADLISWQLHGGPNQQFRLYRPSGKMKGPEDGGVVSFAPRHSPQLRVENRRGGPINVQAAATGSIQFFQLRAVPQGGGSYTIHPLLESGMRVVGTATEALALSDIKTSVIVGPLIFKRSTIGAHTADKTTNTTK